MRIVTVVNSSIVLLLIIATSASPVAAQATKPTSKPSASVTAAPMSKTDTSAKDFLTRGLKELEAGSNAEAQKTFTDGLALYGPAQAASYSTNDSAPRVALNHSLAVANLRLNQLPPARTAMDRAMASKWTNDSLIFNASTVYVAIKALAIQAVNILDPYLASHPEADETWVNLYGLALEKASTDAANRAKLEPKFKSLDAYQARLEKTQPGKHRWGSSWLDEAQWKEIQPQVAAAKQKTSELQKKVESAERALQQAQQSAARASTPAPAGGGGGGGRRRGGGGGGGGNQNRGPTAVATAQQQLTAARAELAAADRGPEQKWEIALTGVPPVIEMVREDAPTTAPAASPSTRPAARRGT